jgi:predicted porin
MKRNLSLLLAGLLVLVMASPLYAAPDIKVTGQIRTRLRYWVDIDLDSNITTAGGAAADRRYFDNRTRLGVDAKLSDGVRAVIQLEKYFDFGNTSPSSAQAPFSGATPGNSAQDPYIRQHLGELAHGRGWLYPVRPDRSRQL